jgi:hypothetical protein
MNKNGITLWDRFIRLYVVAWLDLIESVVCIITFSFYRPKFSFRFICWLSIRPRRRKYAER